MSGSQIQEVFYQGRRHYGKLADFRWNKTTKRREENYDTDAYLAAVAPAGLESSRDYQKGCFTTRREPTDQ